MVQFLSVSVHRYILVPEVHWFVPLSPSASVIWYVELSFLCPEKQFPYFIYFIYSGCAALIARYSFPLTGTSHHNKINVCTVCRYDGDYGAIIIILPWISGRIMHRGDSHTSNGLWQCHPQGDDRFLGKALNLFTHFSPANSPPRTIWMISLSTKVQFKQSDMHNFLVQIFFSQLTHLSLLH